MRFALLCSLPKPRMDPQGERMRSSSWVTQGPLALRWCLFRTQTYVWVFSHSKTPSTENKNTFYHRAFNFYPQGARGKLLRKTRYSQLKIGKKISRGKKISHYVRRIKRKSAYLCSKENLQRTLATLSCWGVYVLKVKSSCLHFAYLSSVFHSRHGDHLKCRSWY